MFNSLSGRFFLLTAVFVLLAEVLIFVPSIARFRSDFLMARVERAQIASLVLLARSKTDATKMTGPDGKNLPMRSVTVYNS